MAQQPRAKRIANKHHSPPALGAIRTREKYRHRWENLRDKVPGSRLVVERLASGLLTVGPRIVKISVQLEVEFGETRFSAKSANGSFSIEWADLHKWKKGKKCLLIYQSEAIMHLVPLHAFSPGEDRIAVCSLLGEKMGPQKP